MLTELLNHPLFRVLQRVGTQVWSAYYHCVHTGHTCWGGGPTAEAALTAALDAATRRDVKEPACRYCDGTGFFYGDPDLGLCGCKPVDNEDLF